jgi:hypothetical protein
VVDHGFATGREWTPQSVISLVYNDDAYTASANKRLLQSSAAVVVPEPRIVPHAHRRPWSADETRILSESYPTHTCLEGLADRLGRSVRALRTKASRLGLRRDFRQMRLFAQSPAPVAQALLQLERRKNGRIIWSNDAVRSVGQLWTLGYTHTLIAKAAECSPGAIRSVANTRAMSNRAGYTLREKFDPAASALIGIEATMIERICIQTGQIYYVCEQDRARSRLSPAFKKTKAYMTALEG